MFLPLHDIGQDNLISQLVWAKLLRHDASEVIYRLLHPRTLR